MSTPDSKTANQGDLLGTAAPTSVKKQPTRDNIGGPSKQEQEFIDWLNVSTKFPEIHVPEFFDRFAGETVPKRSKSLYDEIRTDIIQACLASVVTHGGLLWADEAERIAQKLNYSAWHIKTTWGRYRRSALREETVRLGSPPGKRSGYTS